MHSRLEHTYGMYGMYKYDAPDRKKSLSALYSTLDERHSIVEAVGRKFRKKEAHLSWPGKKPPR